jgi:uncharacterized membrane protein YraQ (UPF0718 family)
MPNVTITLDDGKQMQLEEVLMDSDEKAAPRVSRARGEPVACLPAALLRARGAFGEENGFMRETQRPHQQGIVLRKFRRRLETALLYSGPAINVLAIILTARVLRFEMGVAYAGSAAMGLRA